MALFAAVVCCPFQAEAGTLHLEWDPVENAAGYLVCHGAESGAYHSTVDVGPATAAVLTDLEDCSEHFVAVKAYNAHGESAEFSNEVSGWPRPSVSTAEPPLVVSQGGQFVVGISGSNFQPGVELRIAEEDVPVDSAGNPLVRLESAAAVSCDFIEALLTVEPTARGFRAMEVGEFTVGMEVRNPDSSFGSAGETIRVAFDPSRSDINRSDAATRGRLDGKDLVWLVYSHGSIEGEPRFNPDADLDGNGAVDGGDLAYLATGFGDCWDGSGWSREACP